MMLRRMAWAGVAALVFAGAALGQITALQGVVTGEDGAPLKDALILIERTDVRGSYKVKTNKKGEFYYGGLPRGKYDLSCDVGGQVKDQMRGVTTKYGEPTIVNFDLRTIKARQDAISKAADTGQLSADLARGMSAEEKAKFEQANKQRQQQLAKNKALNDAFNAAMQAQEAKQWDVALDSFKKAAEMDATQDVIWAHLGDVAIQLGLTKTGPERDALIAEGTEAWNKTITIKPTSAAYHNNYALALARAGKLPDAATELQQAATLDPPNAGKYYFNLGALLVNSGKYDEAAQTFRKAIEATPDYAEAHYQYGICLASKLTYAPDGKVIPPAGMQEELETYLKLAPDGPNAAAAKQMLETLGSGVQTTYTNPNAPPPKKGAKKK